MSDDLAPILVGAGQVIEKGVDPAEAMGPIELMAEAASRAADDAGIGKAKLADLDLLVTVKSVLDVLTVNNIPNPIKNPPEALAESLGVQQARQYITATGGNTPQMLVNQTAQGIANGQIRFALLAGAEALDSMARSLQVGSKRDWTIRSNSAPEMLFPERDGTNELEKAHGLYLPAHTYPLFENALRNFYGRTIEDHQIKLGRLFSRFTEVAANNSYAWFPVQCEAEEIAIPSSDNRYVAFPYTKRMTAMIKVNQAAALIMTSVGLARKMGIDTSRWIYLNGCADANDHWYVTERVNYYTSPAIATAGKKALAMAGITIDEIDFLDLYSCFPSAVQISRDMLGIAESDPRYLTVTGGLPYHGGPGNNYSMHAIAAMVAKLRDNPGKKGLVTANGWYITKHSLGIYSTEPNLRPWCREDPSAYQAGIDAQPQPDVVNTPSGDGFIETYTVTYNRDNAPSQGIVIGRLENGSRFLANTPQDRTLLENLTTHDCIGTAGRIHRQENINIFSPD
jgi:acetyl-CoA C-acetyltransferase